MYTIRVKRRLGVIAIMTIMLLSLVFAQNAFAADASMTINATSGQTGIKYNAYQILTGVVNDDDTIQKVAKGSSVDLSKLATEIKTLDPTYSGSDNPQDLAEEMNGQLLLATGINSPIWVDSDTFAHKLAVWITQNGTPAKTDITSGTAFTVPEGYYLITTDESSLSGTNTGTAPIFLPIGGKSTSMSEKSSQPTMTKEIKEDSNGVWGAYADSDITQDVSYRLTGTIPSNLNTYETYHYKFVDEISSGLDLQKDTVKVIVYDDKGGTKEKADITSGTGVTISYDGGLVVDIKDLKVACPSIDTDDIVRVEYNARLNENAVIGTKDGVKGGNPNTAHLEFTHNPLQSDGGTNAPDGHTPDVTVRDYTYEIDINKIDDNTEEPLPGVVFTLQRQDGQYLNPDHSWTDSAYEYTTPADGTLIFKGLDEGKYTLHEVSAPDMYNLITQDIVITLDSDMDDSVSGGAAAKNDTSKTDVTVKTAVDGVADDFDWDSSTDDAKYGIVKMTIRDVKRIPLPTTGSFGRDIVSIVVMSGIIVACSAVLIIHGVRTQKKE